jgi:hypothetical protein
MDVTAENDYKLAAKQPHEQLLRKQLLRGRSGAEYCAAGCATRCSAAASQFMRQNAAFRMLAKLTLAQLGAMSQAADGTARAKKLMLAAMTTKGVVASQHRKETLS